MQRFNTQTADLVEDTDLCRNVYHCFQLGQSIRHIAKKHKISRYAVKRLAKYWQEVNGNEKPHKVLQEKDVR